MSHWVFWYFRSYVPVALFDQVIILTMKKIMIVSFVQVLQESVEKLLPGTGKAEQLPIIAISAMAATIGLKGLIWFGCIPIKTTQVQALAQGMDVFLSPCQRY